MCTSKQICESQAGANIPAIVRREFVLIVAPAHVLHTLSSSARPGVSRPEYAKEAVSVCDIDIDISLRLPPSREAHMMDARLESLGRK